MAEEGEKLFTSLGCATCHLANGTGRGPKLVDLFGSTVKLTDGSTATADENYVRESIMTPTQEKVYFAACPSPLGDVALLLLDTGLRLGEALALRIDDVDLGARLLLVRRGVSAGQETLPKGRRHRFVPLSTPAREAIGRLLDRDVATRTGRSR